MARWHSQVPSFVIWLVLLAAVIIYKYPPQFGKPAEAPIACEGAALEIRNVSCTNGVFRADLENAGSGNMGRSFMVVISSDVGQVYASEETDVPLSEGVPSSLSIVLENWSGVVQSVRISSQACGSVEAAADGLDIYCGLGMSI